MNDPNRAIKLMIKEIQNCVEKIKSRKHTHGKKNKNIPRKYQITSSIIKADERKETLYKYIKILKKTIK